MKQESIIKTAFTTSLPIFLAYFPLGLVFGLVFENSGYYWLLGPLMSAVIYGGAVQFLALSLVEQGTGLLQILIACFFIALRNAFYGPAFFKRFANFRLLPKIFLGFTLVDATYALLLSPRPVSEHDDEKYCLWLSFFIYSYWFFGTLVGAVFGHALPEIKGLEFVLTALFTILAVEQYFKTKSLLPFISALIGWFIMKWWLPQYALLGGIVFALIVISIYFKYFNPGVQND